MRIVKQWIRNVFGFSSREINGVLILLPILGVIIMSEPVYHWWIASRDINFSKENHKLDSLAQLWKTTSAPKDSNTVSLFPFDPNRATTEELMMLGFSRSSSTRIAAYREKGGRFKVKGDLLKIYGLDSSFYFGIESYILLPDELKKTSALKKKPEDDRQSKAFGESKKQPFNAFDLNSADTTMLKSVYGIGSRLATRIIKFRDALGGFITKEQLFEIYGMDSAAVLQLQKKSFIESNFTPQKIDLNSATEQELASHPYIRKQVAKAIMAYRFQHKRFHDVSDLSKLVNLKPEDIERMKPYVEVK